MSRLAERLAPGVLVAALALTACGETPTSVLLRIRNGTGAPVPTSLTIQAWDDFGVAEPRTRLPASGTLPTPSGDEIGSYVIFADTNSGELRIDVVGTMVDARVSEGAVRVDLWKDHQVETDLVLRPGRWLDTDSDGVPDQLDNCPTVRNMLQESSGDDLRGDACNPDGGSGDATDDADAQDAPGLPTSPDAS